MIICAVRAWNKRAVIFPVRYGADVAFSARGAILPLRKYGNSRVQT